MKLNPELYDQLKILQFIAQQRKFTEALEILDKYIDRLKEGNMIAFDMWTSIAEAIENEGLFLQKMDHNNWQTVLDDAFNDGGEARCERFLDLATDYALRFADIDTEKFYSIRDPIVDRALELLFGWNNKRDQPEEEE